MGLRWGGFPTPLGTVPAPWPIPGMVAGAIHVYAPQSYVEVSPNPTLDAVAGNNFSIDAWVYPYGCQTNSLHPIVDKIDAFNPLAGYEFYIVNGQLTLALGDPVFGGQVFTSPLPLNFTAWNFVGVSVDYSVPAVTFYVNGAALLATGPGPSPVGPSSSPLWIGGSRQFMWQFNPYCEIGIDEVEIFDCALATNHFDLIYHAGSAGKCKPCTTNTAVQCPADKTVECGSQWVFDLPISLASNCTNLQLTVLGTVTNSFGLCSNILTRTWQVTDCCTNTATYSQTVTAVDSTPPVITCPQPWTTQCGGVVAAIPPPAVDACCGTNVTVTLLSTAVSGSCPWVWQRTWQATDCCGNTTNCVETITVVDTSPPGITCAPTKTVQCGAVWRFDTPNASDACCGTNVTLSIVGTVTNSFNPCSNVITRTWQVTDCCTNFATCSQTVGVVDTVPPVICCDNIVRYVCTKLVQVFYTPPARDNCSGIASVTCNPPSGTWFTAGTTTTVTATTTDACGNISQCTFTVKIVDQSVWQTLLCGVNDCYRQRSPRWWQRYEPVCGPSACLINAYPTATWKRFDDPAVNRFLGNSWQGLPAGIVQAYLNTRLRPPVNGCAGGSQDDSVSLGLANCVPTAWLWSRYLGSGNSSPGLLGTPWCNGSRWNHPFSFNLASLPGGGNLLPHMNSSSRRLDLLVQDDTTVDYARLRIRYCLPGPVVGGLHTSLTNAIFGRRCWWWWFAPKPGRPIATPFGARLSLGGAGGITVGTPIATLPTNAEVSFVMQDTGGEGADTNAFGSILGRAIKENGVQYSAEVPAGAGEVELVLSLQGQIVHTGTVVVPPGTTRVTLLELLDMELPVGATLQLLKRPPPKATLTLAEPRVVEGAFGTRIVDSITFQISNPVPWPAASAADLVINGVNVPEIELTELRLDIGGESPAYGGDALAHADAGQLVLSPFDPQEDSPVWFSVACAPTNELRVLLGEAIPTDGETFATNATLTLTTRGIAGGVERDLPALCHTFDGVLWHLGAIRDGSPLALSRVELWSGGIRVAEASDVTDLRLASPAPVSWPTAIWFVDDDICYRNTWPTPVLASLNGQAHEVTEVRVQTDTYGQPVTAITGQRVESTALGALVFGGSETGPATYLLEVPEAGPDGITIRWGGLGGVLEQAPTVNGPWTLVPGPNPGEVTVPVEASDRFFRVRGM